MVQSKFVASFGKTPSTWRQSFVARIECPGDVDGTGEVPPDGDVPADPEGTVDSSPDGGAIGDVPRSRPDR
jgi:hypothetical protein